MAEYVGFITNIKPEWMDLAYQCRINGMSKEEAKPVIEEKVALTYKAKENILKTRRVLETIFYDTPSWIVEDSLSIYRSLTDEEKLPLYWALLIGTFPIFYDTCRSVGTIAEYRDVVTITQARQPVYEKWGARNIIHQAVKKVFQTMKDFGVVVATGKPGAVSLTKHQVSQTRLVNYLAVAVLTGTGSSYLTWESIIGNRALFPYEVSHVTQADIPACNVNCLERMGDDAGIRPCH